MVVFKDNPEYQVVYDNGETQLYQPVNIANGYHLNRYIAAGEMNIYAASGATKDYLEIITDEMLAVINKGATDTIKSDLAVLVNNIKFRLKSPIDQDAAVKIGCIYCFIEGEDPNKVHAHITQKKLELADADPEMYAFFLSMGVQYTPAWKELLSHLEMTPDYFSSRTEMLRSLQLNRPGKG